jgi:hypothetical protein
MRQLGRTANFGIGRTIPLLTAGILLASLVEGAEWQIGVVEETVGGTFSSLRVDKFGNAHVAAFDASHSRVTYSFWDHQLNRWFNTPLDFASGFCALALDSKQRPHISYPTGSGVLKHAYWDGKAWKTQPIEIQARIINYFTSIALDSSDNPSISFYEEAGAGLNVLRLRMVTWNGKFWELRTVDPDEGSGKFNWMEIDSAGHPQIVYGNVEYKNASLRYAWWNGDSWERDILEGAGKPGTSMWSVSLVLDKSNAPHIAYVDVTNRLVKYGQRKNGAWQLRAIDSIASVGYPDRTGIALDTEGNPYISYYDPGLGVLKVAHPKDGKWVIEVVDQDFAGLASSLQISHDLIWLTYADATGERLKFARRPLVQKDPSAGGPEGGRQK